MTTTPENPCVRCISDTIELSNSLETACPRNRHHGKVTCDITELETKLKHIDHQDHVSLTYKARDAPVKSIDVWCEINSNCFSFGRRNLTICLTILAVGFKTITYLVGPVWLDYPVHSHSKSASLLNRSSSDARNSSINVADTVHGIDPFFVALTQGVFPLSLLSALLVWSYILRPNSITSFDRSYPKSNFWLTGQTAAFSVLMLNYALSGNRTAPFLQASLGNLLVPIQFTIRLLILRRRPTLRKLLCAVVVMAAEFVCLLPRIFPSLESKSAMEREGGATGISGILWPLAFVGAFIPGTMVNAFMERSVKDSRHGGGRSRFSGPLDDETQPPETHVNENCDTAPTIQHAEDTDDEQSKLRPAVVEPSHLNMVYYLFWYYFFFTLSTVVFFWTDIIPWYGTSANIRIFGSRLGFNFACFFGQAGCGVGVVLLGWITMLANFANVISNAHLLRYSEGANYLCIAMTLRSPLLFLIWTLFDERHQMAWRPQASLSTWLSVGALCVMVPAVFIYNTGPPEKAVVFQPLNRKKRGDDTSALLDDSTQDDID